MGPAWENLVLPLSCTKPWQPTIDFNFGICFQSKQDHNLNLYNLWFRNKLIQFNFLFQANFRASFLRKLCKLGNVISTIYSIVYLIKQFKKCVTESKTIIFIKKYNFFFVVLFITFSNLTHDTYYCIGTSGKKIAIALMRGLWQKNTTDGIWLGTIF